MRVYSKASECAGVPPIRFRSRLLRLRIEATIPILFRSSAYVFPFVLVGGFIERKARCGRVGLKLQRRTAVLGHSCPECAHGRQNQFHKEFFIRNGKSGTTMSAAVTAMGVRAPTQTAGAQGPSKLIDPFSESLELGKHAL